MALASTQDIPKRPEEKQEWSIRRLFPFADVAKTLSKVFVNPFDVLFGFSVLVAGLVELFGRHVSIGFLIIVLLSLGASLFERHPGVIPNKETK